jgi:hypothetical protein
MRALARNKMRMKFETLIVNNCEFGVQGLSEILENFRGLNLDLKYCNINLEGCKLIKNFLAKALEPEKEFQPKSLILSYNKFGDNVIFFFC